MINTNTEPKREIIMIESKFINSQDKIVKNAVKCDICQSPADLINGAYYQCQKNSSHLGDVFVGIFTDMSYPWKMK